MRIPILVYDSARDRDSTHLFYTAAWLSPLAWSSGPRSAASLRGRASAALAITVAAFVSIYLPLLAVGVYLAVSISWLWWFAVIFLLAAETFMTLTHQLFVLKWNAFNALIPAYFLHRYHLFSLNVMYIISFCLAMAAMPFYFARERLRGD